MFENVNNPVYIFQDFSLKVQQYIVKFDQTYQLSVMSKNTTTQQTKTRHEQVLETIDEVTNISSSLGIAQLEVQDKEIHGASIQVNGKKVVNFGY
jgi:hypothetical protein